VQKSSSQTKWRSFPIQGKNIAEFLKFIFLQEAFGNDDNYNEKSEQGLAQEKYWRWIGDEVIENQNTKNKWPLRKSCYKQNIFKKIRMQFTPKELTDFLETKALTGRAKNPIPIPPSGILMGYI